MSSDENVVADNWEDGGAEAVEAIEKRFEQVKILDRKKQELDKLKSDNQEEKAESVTGPIVIKKIDGDSVAEGPGPSQDEPKRVLLRRPKGGENRNEPNSSSGNSNGKGGGRKGNKTQKGPARTLEEKQAQYQAARERIMGTEYKPDNKEIKELTVVERSKSPETVTISRNHSVQQMKELGIDFAHEETGPAPTTMIQPNLFMPDYSIPPPPFVHAPPSQQQSQNEVPSLGISQGIPNQQMQHFPPQHQQQQPQQNESQLFTVVPPNCSPMGAQMYNNSYAFQNNMESYIQMGASMNTQNGYDDRSMQFYTYSQQMLQNGQQNVFQNMPFNMYSIPPPSQPPSLMSLPTNPPPNGAIMYSQVVNNANQRNVKPNSNKNSKGGKKQQNNMNMQNQMQFRPPPMPMPPRMNPNQNPIPYGCPPMDVNQYYNGQGHIPQNSGPGILGPPPYSTHPPMPMMMQRNGSMGTNESKPGGVVHSQQ